MKVALIGASGNGGSRLLAELSRRGHQVTAIARNPDTTAKLPGVTLDLMQGRVERDLWYAEHASLGLDLWILARTPVELLRRRNAY